MICHLHVSNAIGNNELIKNNKKVDVTFLIKFIRMVMLLTLW